MSQIDKLNYLPLLFWFLIFFISLYCTLFMYVLPLVFSALRTRSLFFKQLLNEHIISAVTIFCNNFFYINVAHSFSLLYFLAWLALCFIWIFFFGGVLLYCLILNFF